MFNYLFRKKIEDRPTFDCSESDAARKISSIILKTHPHLSPEVYETPRVDALKMIAQYLAERIEGAPPSGDPDKVFAHNFTQDDYDRAKSFFGKEIADTIVLKKNRYDCERALDLKYANQLASIHIMFAVKEISKILAEIRDHIVPTGGGEKTEPKK